MLPTKSPSDRSRLFEVVYQAPGSTGVNVSASVFRQPGFDDDMLKLRRQIGDLPKQERKDVLAVASFLNWRKGECGHSKPSKILRGALLYFRFKFSQLCAAGVKS